MKNRLIIKQESWIVFSGFFISTFVLRAWTFFRSVLDKDETLYLLVARSVLQGHPPYVQVWDHKPPGLFWLFSGAIAIFGDSIASIRILACLAIALTSYMLYKIGTTFEREGKTIGLIAGIFYLIFTFNNSGTASNAEILFAPFITFAFYLLFNTHQYEKLKIFCIGLFIGLGMQIKYVVVMDFIAVLSIGSFQILSLAKNHIKDSIKELLQFYQWIGIGFFLPFVLVMLYFLSVQHFDDYIYSTLIANQKYVAMTEFSIERMLSEIGNQITKHLLLYLSLLILPFHIFLNIRKLSKIEKQKILFLGFWFCSTFTATLLSKQFFGHYFLHLLPPLSLLSAYSLVKITHEKFKKNIIKYYLSIFLILIFPIGQAIYNQVKTTFDFVLNRQIRSIGSWHDEEAIVANYLKTKVDEEDYIYVVNHHLVTYYLTRAKLPTKFVFISHLTRGTSVIAGRDPLQELKSILNKEPLYIILSTRSAIPQNYQQILESQLKKSYTLETILEIDDDSVMIYRSSQ